MCFTRDKFELACGFLLLGEFNTFLYCCKKCEREFDTGNNLELHILAEHEDDKIHVESMFVNDDIFVDDIDGRRTRKRLISVELVDIKTEVEPPDESDEIFSRKGNEDDDVAKDIPIEVECKADVDLLLDDDFRYDSSSHDSVVDFEIPPVTRAKRLRVGRKIEQKPKQTKKKSKSGSQASDSVDQVVSGKEIKKEEHNLFFEEHKSESIDGTDFQSTSARKRNVKAITKTTSEIKKDQKEKKTSKADRIDAKSVKEKRKRKWKPSQRARFECEMCPGVVYNHKGNIRQHMQTHARAMEQKTCQICNKTPRNYEKHMRTNHSDQRPYKCDICDATYRFSAQLVIHMRAHTGERPFLCSSCGKSFKCPSSKHKHEMRSHLKKRDHTCQECGTSFYSAHQLKDHIGSVHLKLRPFHCDICGKDFGTRKYLYTHKTTHQAPRLQCRYCDKMFKLCENRLKHERGVHKAM